MLLRRMEETAKWEASSPVLTQYYSGGQIMESEIGGACNTYGGEERCIQGFGVEPWKKKATWKPESLMGG
jgi:hypothetical protein